MSPDASWIRASRVAFHADDDGFWQMMPDVVIEVSSKSDEWPGGVAKIEKYVDDGAGYAIAIDPKTRDVHERGTCPKGLVLDITAIIEA